MAAHYSYVGLNERAEATAKVVRKVVHLAPSLDQEHGKA
jgi:hypothetical protein